MQYLTSVCTHDGSSGLVHGGSSFIVGSHDHEYVFVCVCVCVCVCHSVWVIL